MDEQFEDSISKNHLKSLHQQIWMTFPSFCSQAVDISMVFPMLLKDIAVVMTEEPIIRNYLCSFFSRSIKKTKEAIAAAVADDDGTSRTNNFSQLAKYQGTLSQSVDTFVPLLFNLFGESQQESSAVSEAIAAFISIAKGDQVGQYFKAILKKFLLASSDLSKETAEEKRIEILRKRHQMADLLSVIIEFLPLDTLGILYDVIKPHLNGEAEHQQQQQEQYHQISDYTMQKKAYKILVHIFKRYSQLNSEQQKESLKDFLENLQHCHSSTKKFRMTCIFELINNHWTVLSPYLDSILTQFVGECIMGVKDFNSETRELSFKCIEMISLKYASILNPNQATDEQRTVFCNFMRKLLAGFGGISTTIISGTLLVFADLVQKFYNLISRVIPDLLNSAMMLVHYPDQEVVRGVVDFLKTVTTLIPPDLFTKQNLEQIIDVF